MKKYLFWGTAVLAVVYAVYQSVLYRWLCDDSFISFVYSRNLAEGFGLVFQKGEYVEGYSNFLWTLVLSLGMLFSLSPLLFSQVLGILCYVGLLLYFLTYESRSFKKNIIPFFTLHLSLLYHFKIFATSGLETMAFISFLTIGLIEWDRKKENASWYLFVASLLRPEGILFLGIRFLSQYKSWKKFSIWFPCLGFGFFELFRIFYYGDILPNTFYAKANHPSYFSQGIFYLGYWMKVYPFYLPVFIGSVFLLVRSFFRRAENVWISSSVLIYIAYVLYIGGDFMGMRFWIPILPYLSWIVYLQLSEVLSSQIGERSLASDTGSEKFFLFGKDRFPRLLVYFVFFLFLLSSAVYINPFRNENSSLATWNGIGEERRFYGDKLNSPNGYDRNSLQGFRVAFFGAQAHYIYWMRPDYAWEAESGLTDKRLARKSTSTRGRVGHEKVTNREDITEREIDLVLSDRYPDLDLPYILHKWRDFEWKIYVVRYKPSLFLNLCERKQWNCSPLYKEIWERKMDREKEIHFLQ